MKQARGYHGYLESRPFKDRFEEKVIFSSATECWVWRGAASAHRANVQYRQGHIRGPNGETLIASRAAWILYRGPIPGGLHVLHTCDNSRCVNPHHLFLGTNADNIADRVKKKRSTLGELDGAAKLTEAQVRQIHDEIGPVGEIARRFGLGRSQVRRIRKEETWRHLWAEG